MVSWVSLPEAWELQDVQAILNVVITALSGITIYVFSRCCWGLSARVVAKGTGTSVSSMLSLNTPGEAIDIFILLKSHLPRHGKLFAQSVLVIFLSITTVLSGPIAKYSTRLADAKVEVRGLLAGRTDPSIGVEQVAWNVTRRSLDLANFPLDQLLDYIPDTVYSWVYRPEEWNNSWAMACTDTESTPVRVQLTSDCTTFAAKFGGVIEKEVFPAFLSSKHSYYMWADYYLNDTLAKDLLVSLYAANYSDKIGNSSDFGPHRRVDMSMGTLHVHDVPFNQTGDSGGCRYGEGVTGSASFTRIDCKLTRAPDDMHDPNWIAYPDIPDASVVSFSLNGNYFQRFKQESMTDSTISIITPRDLRRFYQTYMITKDTQSKRPVERRISVKGVVVQLSTVYITIFGLLALFNCVGATSYGLLMLRYREPIASVPQSKLDWLVQSIMQRARGTENAAHWPANERPKRDRFEGAIYDAAWAGDTQTSADAIAIPPAFPGKMIEPHHLSTFPPPKPQ